MSNYYTEVKEDILAGHVAYAEDINLIQDSIEAAMAQLICDNFGDGYALSSEESAFTLTPVGINEQVDQFNHGELSWKSMSTIYLRQTISIEKSSIHGIRVYMKNTSGANRVVHAELRTVETSDIDSILAASYEVTLEASQTTGTYVDFLFNLDHIAPDDLYLVIKYADGVWIRYDDAGGYNGSLSTSVDGIQYVVEETDLWFEQRYATTLTYNILPGEAVIHGEKIQSMDTHITIPARSNYGDRIDIVIMTKDGEYEVIIGNASTEKKPIPPDDQVPYGSLKIAYITVPQSTDSPILIDQDDSLGKSRLRSHNERLRRLEKKTEYIFTKNAPGRIKYNLTGSSFYDGASSTNISPIVVGEVTTGYRLADSSVEDYYWSFKDFKGNPPLSGEYENNNGISEFLNIDHADHTLGTCKLQKIDAVRRVFCSWKPIGTRLQIPRGLYASDSFKWKRKCYIYRNNAKVSTYPGNTFKVETRTEIHSIKVEARHYRNCASVKMVLYRRGGSGTYIATSSNTYNLNNYPKGKDGVIRTELLEFQFGGLLLNPGEYAFVLAIEPKYLTKPGETWIDTIDFRGRVGNFTKWQGLYPPKIPSKTKIKYQLAETMVYDVLQDTEVLSASGTIKSSMIDTTYGIGSIYMDLNLQLPADTYYKLYVTNDNGTTWQRITTKYLNFPQTSGHQFMWRLELYSNNEAATPILSYNPSKQYAIKTTLGLVSGTPETKGSLVTVPFCGDSILQQALPVGSSIDKFSHWEWLRMWGSENGGEIKIDIETTDNTATGWTNIKTGIDIEDLYRGSVDYSNYEGSYEEDEYNYYCDLNEEIVLQDEVSIDQCEEVWSETPDDDYLTHTIDTGEGKFIEGTQSTKTTFTDYTGDTGQESVFMSKELDSENFSDFSSIKLWILTDIADGLSDDEIQFCIGTSAKCATGEYHSLPNLEKDVWKQVTISPTNPESLTNIVSIGIKRPSVGTAWDEESIWVDSVMGYTSNIGVIDECETAYTSDQGANVSCTTTTMRQSGSYSASFYMQSGATTGLVAHRQISLDLSEYKQIRLRFRTSIPLQAKDFELVFGSNSACTSIIGEGYYLPATTQDIWQTVTFDIENPEDLSNVLSIGLRMLNDKSATLLIDRIEGIKTTEHPFYQKCVRFRFNLTREQGTDISPVIRKVGVMPIIE